MLSFLLIRGAMLRKMILMLANVPECAAIYPVAVEMEQHIVCQMRVRPGRRVSPYSAMQMRNPPDWKQTWTTFLTLGRQVQNISLGLICFLQPIRSTVAFMLTDSRSGGGTPHTPALFLKTVLLRQCRGHLAFLSQMWGGENGMHTLTIAALFFCTV